MRLNRNYIVKLLLLTLVISTLSCEKEDYPLFLNSDEQANLGEMESLEIYSGMSRVLITGVVDDPAVSEVRIYWNNRSDSIVVPVSTSSNEVDSITEIITGLQEKLYLFEVRNFDDSGNSSKSVTAGATVFGSNYSSSLENRPIASSELRDSTLQVEYGLMDMSSGVIGTELTYESTSGENKEIFISIDEGGYTIPDFRAGSTYRYRTAFVPGPMALDTLYTDYSNLKPILIPELINASAPFEVAEASGRWGTLAHWITNDAIKNHDGYGGWDQRNGFNIESGWGAPAIVNGKIYQTVTTGAASFTLNVEFNNHNHSESDEGGFYIVVAKGEGLPDVEDIATAPEVLGYERVVESKMSYSVDFTVQEAGIISIGVVTTQDESGRYGPIRSFEIVR